MTKAPIDSPLPTLFAHAARKDWGLAILAAEANGKRRYLFEDGEERSLADGYYQLMRRVERPDDEQRAVSARLQSVLTLRNKGAASTASIEGAFFDQLLRLHETYGEGLSDAKWTKTVRGEGAEQHSGRHRQPLIEDARNQLSPKELDSLLSSQNHAQVWEKLLTVLRQTDLVPAPQLKLKPIAGEPLRALAVSVRDLLYGRAPYEQRFDRFVAAFVVAFGEYPKWDLATAPSAIVHTSEHVCVEPAAFRRQLKLSGSSRSVGAQPSSAAYATFLSLARTVSNKLAEHREVPRDLLDVRDFIVLTAKPPAKARVTRPKASSASRRDIEGHASKAIVEDGG